MTATYHIGDNLTATSTVPPIAVNPYDGYRPGLESNHSFDVTLTAGASGSSVTVQPQGRNDGVNWQNYGPALTVTGTPPVAASLGGTQRFKEYGAIVTAISGVGATATVLMVA